MSRLSQNIEIKQSISTDDILNLTSQGLDIFTRELGNIPQHKNISSPFRKDANPSMRIKASKTSGIYLATDYTTGEVFTPFTFIAKLYNLEFKDVINKIAFDFGLKNKEGIVDYQKVNIISVNKPKIIEKPILYEYQTCSFTKEAHKYWGVLKEDFLNENNVFMVSKLAFNKKVVDCPKDEQWYVMGTGDPLQKGIQILRIGKNVDKSQKWRTNISNFYVRNLFKYSKENPVKNLFIVKSKKDELILQYLNYNTVSVMSENVIILDQNMPKIIEVSDNQILNWGADNDAICKKNKICEKYKNLKVFTTPLNLVNNKITDNFEYCNTYGIKSFNNLLNNFLNKLNKK